MRHTRNQKKRSRRTRKYRGGYDAAKAKARVASLQQMLGNASKKVASVKSDLVEAAKEAPGLITRTPVTVVNLPAEAEAPSSTVKASTFAAKNNAPVSFAPSRPVSPFGKPQARMAKLESLAAAKELPGSSNASLPPSARAPPPPPPPPAPEDDDDEEEEQGPNHAPLERQKGKRYLKKPAHLRFSNLEEEGPVADPTVHGTTRWNRNRNRALSQNLATSRQSISNLTPLRGKYQRLSEEEASILAKISANANTAPAMLSALNTYTLSANSKQRIAKKIQMLYKNQ